MKKDFPALKKLKKYSTVCEQNSLGFKQFNFCSKNVYVKHP